MATIFDTEAGGYKPDLKLRENVIYLLSGTMHDSSEVVYIFLGRVGGSFSVKQKKIMLPLEKKFCRLSEWRTCI